MVDHEHTEADDPALDAAMRSALGDAAGAPAPAGPALDALRPRLVRARRAQRLRVVGATAVVLAGVVVTALAVGPSGPPRVVAPAGKGGRTGSSTSTTAVAPTLPRPSRSGPVPDTPAGPAPVGPTAPSPPAPPPTVVVPGTAPGTAPPATSTYEAPGGSVTVRFEGGALALVAYAPNPGYVAAVHRAVADDVEVRFEREHEDGAGHSRVRVRLDEGVPVVETE
jgi:hypothetical protein